jgi:hypothetical protein
VTSPASPYRFEKNRGVIVFLRSLKQLGVEPVSLNRIKINATAFLRSIRILAAGEKP